MRNEIQPLQSDSDSAVLPYPQLKIELCISILSKMPFFVWKSLAQRLVISVSFSLLHPASYVQINGNEGGFRYSKPHLL